MFHTSTDIVAVAVLPLPLPGVVRSAARGVRRSGDRRRIMKAAMKFGARRRASEEKLANSHRRKQKNPA